MQPCSREMQAMNSILNHQPLMPLQEFRNVRHQQQIPSPQIQHELDPTPSHDDFIDQMLSSCWPDIATKSPWDQPPDMEYPDYQFHFENDQSVALASKLRQQQIGGGGGVSTTAAAKSFLIQQQLLFQSRDGGLRSPTSGSGAGESGLLSMPLRLGSSDDVGDISSFRSPNLEIDGSVQALYNGFVESLHGTGQTSNNFHHTQGGMMQGKNYGAAAAGMSQSPSGSGSAGGGAAGQPRQRVRARRGQATDPHSIAERLRRERIAERMKALQELVPNGNKADKASMLDEIIDYVKFLQLQVKVLSMSRLGGAAAVAPLVADISSEGGGDCIQASGIVGSGSNGTQTASTSNNNNESMTVTENKVAKMMEEDMGSAMQYLQGKGLCLMPISLATVISTATSQSRSPLATNGRNHPLLRSNVGGGVISEGVGPSSPSMSVLTVQSSAFGNGDASAVKDGGSVSKP